MVSGPSPVLVVEDSPTQQRVLRHLLHQLGWPCDVRSDGASGVEAAIKGAYEVVLMDLELPGLNGIEATQRIHAQLGPLSPLIVAVTGHGKPIDRSRCEAAGLDDFLVKPVRLQELARLLKPRHTRSRLGGAAA